MLFFLLKRDDTIKGALVLSLLLAPLVLLPGPGWSGALGFLQVAIVLALAAIPTLFLLWLLDRQIRESESADAPQVRRL
jgi:hypothetical protein